MNNFSPSTDTSVGTKRFTAQEVQLAYTLMAVEYMKTIKGLNPEPVRGFFNEYLNSELTPHRKVFEVLADKMKTPYQEHQLSGLGFSSTMRNSVIVKVDGTFSRTLKVNF